MPLEGPPNRPENTAEVLRLCDVVQRIGFGRGTCFRLPHTLHHCGLLDRHREPGTEHPSLPPENAHG